MDKNSKTIMFKVDYLGHCGCGFKRNVTRKMELKETQTLDTLHDAIIYKSFKWDDPHLYSFFMDNKAYTKNRKMEYTCDPEPDLFGGEPNSSSIKLKDLNLEQNQKFLFVFDFGDDHRFGITVKGFGETLKGKRYPLIIEEKGKAPEQYPYYEE